METTATSNQTRSDIFTPEVLDALRESGITEAYLFGSAARGEERTDSDIDLLVQFDPSVGALASFGVAEKLERLTQRHFDIATRIEPAFVPYIQPTLLPIAL